MSGYGGSPTLDGEVVDFRFRAFGETASLVIHDLTGPVHAINFCVQLLRDQAAVQVPSRYLDQIGESASRVIDTIAELRSFLKKPNPGRAPASLGDILNRALHMIKLRYFHRGIEAVKIVTDDSLRSLYPLLDSLQTEHVLFSLLSYRIGDLIACGVEIPQLSVALEDRPPDCEAAVVRVTDNSGSCLSGSDQNILCSPELEDYFGLGLTCRILEKCAGRLNMQSFQSVAGVETVTRIILPCLPEEPNGP